MDQPTSPSTAANPLMERASAFPAGGGFQSCFQVIQEGMERGSQRQAPLTEFDHIQAAFPTFALAHETLRFLNSRGQFHLGDTQGAPRFPQVIQQDLVIPGSE